MKQKILFLLLSALLLASCSSDDDGLSPDTGIQAGGQIRFEIGFATGEGAHTKAATGSDFKTVWETGDEIGIFAVKGSGSLSASGNYLDNMKLICQSNGTWQAASSMYYPNDGDKLHFYAYYPYTSSIDPTSHTFSVKADQRGTEYNKSDLLLAKAENISKSDNVVQLTFSHALSLVQVEVTRESNVPLFVDADFTVTLAGVLPDAALNWSGDLTGTGTAADIVMHKVEGMPYTYRALVPAQTLATNSKVAFVQTTTDKEIDMEYLGVKSTSLTAKNAHKYSVVLGWGIDPDHEYAVGDVYPHTGPIVGIVFWLDNPSNGKSKHGKVVSLQEEKDLAWADNTDCTNVNNTTNGLVNMQLMTQYVYDNDKSWVNFPAFAWVHNLNNASENYSNSNVTGVWYLPAKDELQYLYCVWNGESPATWSDYVPSWNPDIEARKLFNRKLTAAGGTELGIYWYQSSSECNSQTSWYVDFANGPTSADIKSNFSIRFKTRCILAF